MLALLLQVVLQDTVPVRAPVAPAAAPTSTWHAAASAGTERFSSDQKIWQPWLTAQASLRHRGRGNALGVEIQRTRRFDQWDQSYVVDAYQSVTSRTYANVRVLVTPNAKIVARNDVSAELYRALSGGWEASVAGRRMEFAAGRTGIVSTSLARSFDAYYARLRAGAVLGNGGAGSFSALLRRAPDENQLIEAGANVGREVVSIAAGGEIDIRSASGAYARAERYLDRHWGVAVIATLATARNIPSRYGAQLSLLRRW